MEWSSQLLYDIFFSCKLQLSRLEACPKQVKTLQQPQFFGGRLVGLICWVSGLSDNKQHSNHNKLVLTQQPPKKNPCCHLPIFGKTIPHPPIPTSKKKHLLSVQPLVVKKIVWSQVAETECGTARKRLARPKVSEKKRPDLPGPCIPKNGQALSLKKHHIIKKEELDLHNKKHELKFMATEF